jgi:uncharacterized protein YgbK (DUF1537 family)
MAAEATSMDAPWGPVPAPVADDSPRVALRALRAEHPRLTTILDDDPTGSQSVRDIQIVTELVPAEYRAALADGACFVLTNSRSCTEPEAAAIASRVADDLFAIAADRGLPLELVSRSDSTLRGHVVAEVRALQSARTRALGHGFDAVLLVPAFIEAGRVTAGDVHWANVNGRFRPVSETEFARDAVFGYRSADLREFLVERAGGTLSPDQVGSISLTDIRGHGAGRVADLIGRAPAGGFLVVNALDHADLEIVALGALRAQLAGAALLYRCGPSFVRALLGQDRFTPLTDEQIWPSGPGRGHGLVVVGSHVGQTSRQLAALGRQDGWSMVELAVPDFLALGESAAERFLAETAERVRGVLAQTDAVLYTSRTLVRASERAANLEISRQVSRALSAVVRLALAAEPAWVLAKGGITAHDVAVLGLGIRRAEVVGQFFPGLVSMIRPLVASPAAVGRPYVIFAGNVGGDDALSDVAGRLRGSAG